MIIEEKTRERFLKNPKINLRQMQWPEKEELKIFLKDILSYLIYII